MILLKLIQFITLGLTVFVVFTQLIIPLTRGTKLFPYFRTSKVEDLKEEVEELREEVDVFEEVSKLKKQKIELQTKLEKPND